MNEIETKPEAEALVAMLPPGGRIVSASGLLSVERVEVPEDPTTPIRWTSGRVVTFVSGEAAVRRLSAFRPGPLSEMGAFGPEGEQLAGAAPEAGYHVEVLGAPEGYGERVHVAGHVELARRRATEIFNEMGGAYEVAVTDAETKRRKEAIKPKGQGMTETKTKNGARKKTAAMELPRGFKVGTGADLAPADLVVTDAPRGPERVVSVGSGGVSRGKTYLKLMLEPVEGGGEARRRFISPRKEYPIKKATKAEAEKAAKKVAAAQKPKEDDKLEAEKKKAGAKATPKKATPKKAARKPAAEKPKAVVEAAPAATPAEDAPVVELVVEKVED